ncbi:hypothetical protein [Actinomadura macrotermitis]|uniref:Secreted protein n=1 Tax=Actinomadura macrotermitis TaxID=2585200 RepID=A0A7K0BP56_9ACTN|nr:hypothetical protein [Actinomadura macrotermitis]MQY02979.1 hypothetical protein [Actinomadura macrotermitis]
MTAVQQAPAAAPAVAGPPPRRRPRLLPRTATGRIRALTAAVIVALAATITATWLAVGDARDGVRVIGHDAGPQVVATGDLYFQLTDMDAQLANALLLGRSQNLGTGRDQALARYDDNRAKAGAALLQAAKLADEPSEEATARDLLKGLGRYERLAGQALLADQESDHTAGPPSERVTGLYRQATDMMKLDLLPKAYNLTLDNGTLVRHTYEDERTSVKYGIGWVLGTGLLLVALLAALQLFLAVRFRRLLNPALAAATLAALVLTGAGAVMLGGQLDHLRAAKEDGFDSILALSRARAIGNSANADQTRYLLDPKRADTYEQVFLSKSQSVLYVKAGNLADYNAALQKQTDPKAFLGFLGDEANRPALPGRDAAMAKVLADYRRFQQDDRAVRTLAASGRLGAAISTRLGQGDNAAARDFAAYDASLVKLIQIHRTAFDDAVAAGDDGTAGWRLVLPAAALVIAVLVLAGVRPRLAEYR